MVELTQFVITGLTVGMVYALIALGFVLVWKSSGVANLALGQLVLVSSWFTYGMLVQVGLPIWLGFLLVILFALGMGWLIERVALRPLITQPILSLITVTLGVAFFIQGAVSFIWPKSVAALPSLFPQEPVHIGAAVVSQEYLWAAAISLILFGALSLFFKYHKMGIVMRAVADKLIQDLTTNPFRFEYDGNSKIGFEIGMRYRESLEIYLHMRTIKEE